MTGSKLTMIVVLAALAASCGTSDKPSKGGGAKGSVAKDEDQKTGGKAKGMKDTASPMGESYLGVTCDASTDGLGWCDNDFDIAFCDAGSWYLLDCSVFGAFCGDDGVTIDCYF